MKRNILKNTLPLCAMAVALGFTACTGDFESINTDPNGIPTENVPLASRFDQPIVSVYLNYQNRNWEYQLQQNLNADLYSGYLANPTPFGGNNNNSTYAMNEGWNGMAFEASQLDIMKPISLILKSTEEPDYVAIAKIIRVEGMHRVADIYGPIPYSKAMQGGATVAYDDLETLYKTFLTELKESVDALTQFVDEGKAAPERLQAFDKVCGNDHKQWIRFANTLRLRLAMRIVNVEPALAKSTAEEAVNHKYGVLVAGNPDVEVVDPNLMNPLAEINYGYGDIRMGASMISLLQGYNDPRLPKYATPVGWLDGKDIKVGGKNTGNIGKYIGIRQGIIIPDKTDYYMYSTVNMPKDKMAGSTGEGNQITNALPWMKVSEAYFLRAEGAVRGWNMGGSAKSFYEQGIKVSFDEYNIPAEQYAAYIADGKSVAADHVDPFNPKNNIKGLDKTTIKWDEGVSKEEKLHKIINQKWIAMFPEGQEAWSEFRRTGYPKLFPVANNFSGTVEGGIVDGEFVKRLRFTRDERNSNGPEVENARKLLNGPDNEATRLWWDTQDDKETPNNF